MSLSTYTTMHVGLSLAGIATGILVLLRPSASPKAWGLTALFLATTFAASVTGLLYLLAFARFGMGHAIGIVSLIVFVPTLLALHHRMVGAWRRVYVAGATALLYLNAFIAVMQAFGKIGLLRTLPATTLGSPLLLAHLLLAAICLWLGLHALGRLQVGSDARAKPRRARPLRVADRWG
jgi:hypothetical protein